MTDSKYYILKKICTILYILWFIVLILELTDTISGSGYSLAIFSIKLMFDAHKDNANPIMPDEIKYKSIKQTYVFSALTLGLLLTYMLLIVNVDILLKNLLISAIISAAICIVIFSRKN